MFLYIKDNGNLKIFFIESLKLYWLLVLRERNLEYFFFFLFVILKGYEEILFCLFFVSIIVIVNFLSFCVYY